VVLKELTIRKNAGTRDYSLIVQRAMRFNSEVLMEVGSKKINCKSVMGMISLGLHAGESAVLIAKGDDEEAAMADIAELIENL